MYKCYVAHKYCGHLATTDDPFATPVARCTLVLLLAQISLSLHSVALLEYILIYGHSRYKYRCRRVLWSLMREPDDRERSGSPRFQPVVKLGTPGMDLLWGSTKTFERCGATGWTRAFEDTLISDISNFYETLLENISTDCAERVLS